nr:LysR family transcriptional regulator [Companilactobacillus halodurans]
MRLLQLRYFSMVAKTENVSRSARILHISQPSLSRALNELETELNVKLFVRNGHSLKLNENGLIFKKYVNHALKIIDESVIELKRKNDAQKDKVTFRFEKSSPLIPNIIHQLKQELPHIQVDLIQNGLENDSLAHYDFEFSTHKINGNVNELLLTEEIMVGVNYQNPLANNKEITLKEVKNNPIILTTPSPLRTSIESFFQSQDVILTPAFVTGDHYTLKGLLDENIGISFIPTVSWNNIEDPKIKLIHLSPKKLQREIYLSYPISSSQNPFNKKVITLIKMYFAQMKKQSNL